MKTASETEMSHMVLGVIAAMECRAFCVNRIEAAFFAERKATQLAVARLLEFQLPATAITNDLAEIRKLHSSQLTT